MSTVIKLSIAAVVIIAVIFFSYRPLMNWWEERNRPRFKTEEVEKGEVVAHVNSTGNVQPVISVSIGSFVSGPIVELNVDFNDEVKKDDVLARVDPRLFKANVARDKATLETRKADVDRAKALLQQSKNKEERGKKLRAKNIDFMSDTEMDALTFERQSLEAALRVAEASVIQAQATLENSEANLKYTEIVSPVDGIILDRRIDPGQTLAAQFQTPELFIVAPDLRKEVHILASVDESEIGLIQKAKKESRPVTFTVDTHPDELFAGSINQIRLSSSVDSNVVTYPVIVSAANPDLKLLPGMTASISFEVDSKKDVLKVPNAALRFYPNTQWVHPDDIPILDGSRRESTSSDTTSPQQTSAEEKAEAYRRRNRRHVWVLRDKKLRAIEVITGLIETRFTEIIEGDLKEGDELVTGLELKK